MNRALCVVRRLTWHPATADLCSVVLRCFVVTQV